MIQTTGGCDWPHPVLADLSIYNVGAERSISASETKGGAAMGITEDLKSLEEMKARGTLTAAEFDAAKVAAISKHGQPATAELRKPGEKKQSLIWRIAVFVVILLVLGFWYTTQQNGGTSATTALKAVVHMPVDLKNEVENLPAASWKAVAIQVPYDGSLTVSTRVQRGNPVEVFVTDNSHLKELKSGNPRATYVGGFYAPKAMRFQHTEWFNQGTYFVVLRDTSLGILSASTSDISLKVSVEP